MLSVPKNLQYKPFQEEAIRQILVRKRILLADECGLGKTIQAIGVINNAPNVNRVLIICPASVKLNWERELQVWLTKFYNIDTLYGQAPVELTSPEITIINYDILHWHQEYLLKQSWDICVIDECQYLAYVTSKRVGVFSGLGADIFLCMSATPGDKVIKLWPVLHKLMPEKFGNYRRFLFRYCGAKSKVVYYKDKKGVARKRRILDINGASHTQELSKILKNNILIRRFREDKLNQLPPQRQVIPFQVNIEYETNFLKSQRLGGMALNMAWENLQMYTGKIRGDIRRACGIAKLPLIIDFLKGIQHKVIVSAYHRVVLERLHGAFKSNSYLIYGGQTPKKKEEIKNCFTNSKSHGMLFIQSQAGGIGIDGLQKVCSHIIFAEIDWSPDIMEHNEGRLARIGQDKPILVQYLVADGSIESYIARKAAGKAQVKNEIFN